MKSQMPVHELPRFADRFGRATFLAFRLWFVAALPGAAWLAPLPAECASGQLDTSFSASLDGTVHACAIHPATGKIIVAGAFSDAGSFLRHGLAALNSDGSPDSSFYVYPPLTGTVTCFAIQTDAKIVYAETFYSSKSGTYSSKVGRLLINGTADATFPIINFNGRVTSIGMNINDNKAIVGGDYTTVNGLPPSYLSRFTTNGVLDGTFYPNPNGPVNVVGANNYSGAIAIGGQFTWVAGGTHYYFESLSSSGTHNGNYLNSPDPDSPVTALADQNLDTIIGGGFATIDGASRVRLGRFNYNGGLDGVLGTVPPFLPLQPIFALSTDSGNESNLYIGGLFSYTVNSVAYQSIVRYYGGSQDLGFCAGTINGAVNSIAVQGGDGKVLIGGGFTSVQGQTQSYIARLLP